jgi:hypothetical protein
MGPHNLFVVDAASWDSAGPSTRALIFKSSLKKKIALAIRRTTVRWMVASRRGQANGAALLKEFIHARGRGGCSRTVADLKEIQDEAKNVLVLIKGSGAKSHLHMAARKHDGNLAAAIR